jgi:hypothetical protein
MSERVRDQRWRLAVRLAAAALVWSAGLLLAAMLVGAYKGQTVSTDAGLTLTTRTFVQVHGAGALALVVVPVAACLAVAVALWQRRHRQAAWAGPVAWAVVAVVAVEAGLAITSFGVLLIPVALLLAAGLRLVPAAPARRARA